MANGRWSDDAFLDTLRAHTDALADDCVRRLVAEKGVEAASRLFRDLTSNDGPLPADAPVPVREFLRTTAALPPGVDLDRISRGEAVWMKHAFPASLVLLAKALPEGYAAPSFGQILSISGDLLTHPYRRLLGVLQMVVDVCGSRGFRTGGKAVVTAQKLRLLHAGIRVLLVPRYRPSYDVKRLGPPVNLEDMLATIMGFSYLVIDGLDILGAGLHPQEAEDLYYVWRVYAQLMGIHSPDRPHDDDWVPASLGEAREFYQAFARRHYVSAAENPMGVDLAAANLRMLRQLLPWSWRLLGLGIIPRIYMQDLIGSEGCARVGIEPVPGHRLLKWLLLGMVHLSHRVLDATPARVDERVSQRVFQGMINRGLGGEVTFSIPATLEEARKLA